MGAHREAGALDAGLGWYCALLLTSAGLVLGGLADHRSLWAGLFGAQHNRQRGLIQKQGARGESGGALAPAVGAGAAGLGGPGSPAGGSGAAAAAAGRARSLLEALGSCEDFECLRDAHSLPREDAHFNFPHFLIIGWQKCATSSLHRYLSQHPQVLPPAKKEAHFFTRACAPPNSSAWACPRRLVRRYLLSTLRRDEAVAAGLKRAAFEATPAYSRAAARLAPELHRELPWLRIVASFREPVSRLISELVMAVDFRRERGLWGSGQLPDNALERCLLRLSKREVGMYECLKTALDVRAADPGASSYAAPLSTWLEAFPRDQVHILQYENLTSAEGMGPVLSDLMRFLGLDPALLPAKALPTANSRRGRHSAGWSMQRAEYEQLLQRVRPDAEALAALLEQKGYTEKQAWLQAWEAAWQRNLEACDAQGQCRIQLT